MGNKVMLRIAQAMTIFLKQKVHRLMIWLRCTGFAYRLAMPLLGLLLGLLISAMPAQARIDQPSTPSDQRLADMVLGIISYTQWSQSTESVHLCVIDSAYYFNALLPIQRQSQQWVQVSLKTAKTTDLTQQCHVLFFEQTAPAQQQEIINQRGIRRILSISLNNPLCVVGSSFCISTHGDLPTFSVNLDSLKQSGIKISSKVLILSKPALQQD